MKKFSKIDKKKGDYKKKDDIKYTGKYLQVIQFEDWEIVKESDVVVCIPYFIETNQFLIRKEYIPTYKYSSGQDYHLALIGGIVEDNEDIEVALLRELEEEAGIVIRDNFKLDIDGPLFTNKVNCTKYYMSIISLNENDYHEVMIKGDGTKNEQMSETVRLDIKYLNNLKPSDVLTSLMIEKLKRFINM